MIVCHCHAVSDREIRRVAAAGATSVDDVARHCRAASGCGGCSMAVLEILDEVQGQTQAQVQLPVPTAPALASR